MDYFLVIMLLQRVLRYGIRLQKDNVKSVSEIMCTKLDTVVAIESHCVKFFKYAQISTSNLHFLTKEKLVFQLYRHVANSRFFEFQAFFKCNL